MGHRAVQPVHSASASKSVDVFFWYIEWPDLDLVPKKCCKISGDLRFCILGINLFNCVDLGMG